MPLLSVTDLERGSLIRIDRAKNPKKYVVVRVVQPMPRGAPAGNPHAICVEMIREDERDVILVDYIFVFDDVRSEPLSSIALSLTRFEREGATVLMVPGVVYELPANIK